MFRFTHMTVCLLGSLLYSLSNSAQTSDRSKSTINKIITAKDQDAFNTSGNVTGVKYSDVNGSPFWKREYTAATLYNDSAEIGTALVKMNLLTNEVYFLKGKEELVLDEPGVNKIVYVQAGETTTFIREVPNLFLDRKKVNDFVQVMNKGRYEFLKYTKKEIASADSGLSSKKYFFRETHYYFLKVGQKIERIQKLRDQYVLSYLPGSNSFRDWIKSNNIDFRKEQDIISFLNYFNKTLEKKNSLVR